MLGADPAVDAVVCGSDRITTGFVEAVRERGRRVPDGIAVVGHDDWEVLSTETRPPLTTVDMNAEVLGRTAAQYLFAAIGGSAASGVHPMPCSLTVRGSTAGGGAAAQRPCGATPVTAAPARRRGRRSVRPAGGARGAGTG